MNDAMTDRFSDTTVRAPVRAVVCTGGVETEYIRMGRGELIVVVAADTDAVEVQEMIARLATHYLVLAVAPRVEPSQLTAWMQEFLEGLGFADAHLLVHAKAMDTTTEI